MCLMTFPKEIMDRESSYIGFRFFLAFWTDARMLLFSPNPTQQQPNIRMGGSTPPTQQQHKGGSPPLPTQQQQLI